MYNASALTAGGKGGTSALTNALGFVLCHRCEYANGQRVKLRHVECTYRETRVLQLEAKLNITGKAVELSDNENAPRLATVSNSGGKLRAAAVLASLDLNELGAIETSVLNSEALTIETEPAFTLLASGYT
jgi:hypothetical protein